MFSAPSPPVTFLISLLQHTLSEVGGCCSTSFYALPDTPALTSLDILLLSTYYVADHVINSDNEYVLEAFSLSCLWQETSGTVHGGLLNILVMENT